MIKSEFERARQELKIGLGVSLCLRGNYGEYIERGILQKIEGNRVFLDKGFSHHYKRIVSMTGNFSIDEK
jgi:hypothetical protein